MSRHSKKRKAHAPPAPSAQLVYPSVVPAAASYQAQKGFIWFGLITGLAFLSFYIWTSYSIAQAKKWPSIAAVVTVSRMVPNNEARYGKVGTHSPLYDHLDLIFTYTVAGHQYSSSHFYRWRNPPGTWAANDYPLGHAFLAYYDPNDPAEAIVEPGTPDYGSLVIAIFCLAVFIPPLVYGLFQKFRHPQNI